MGFRAVLKKFGVDIRQVLSGSLQSIWLFLLGGGSFQFPRIRQGTMPLDLFESDSGCCHQLPKPFCQTLKCQPSAPMMRLRGARTETLPNLETPSPILSSTVWHP